MSIAINEDHVALADTVAAFLTQRGSLTEARARLDGAPEVFEIDYTAAGLLRETYGGVSTRERGVAWHTDVTFVARPPLGSILRAVVVPESSSTALSMCAIPS